MELQANYFQSFPHKPPKKPLEEKAENSMSNFSIFPNLHTSDTNFPNCKQFLTPELNISASIKPKRPVLLLKPGNSSQNSIQKPLLASVDKSTPNIPKTFQNLRTVLQDYSPSKKKKNVSVESATKEGGPVSLVKAYLDSGYSCANNKDNEKALGITLQAKSLIDKYLAKNWKFDFETLFLTYYNLSSYTYK